MNTKTIMAMTALNAAILAGAIYTKIGGEERQIQLVTEVQTSAIYDAATKECQDEIDKAPSRQCEPCQRIFGDATKPDNTWCCGAAVMGPSIKACLDTAVGKLAKAPKLP